MILSKYCHILPTILILLLAPTFCLLWLPIFLFVLPISRQCFIYVDDKMYSLYQRCIIFFYEHLAKTEVIFYGDLRCLMKRRTNFMLLSNHQSSVDWIAIDFMMARLGGIGRLRFVLKEQLKNLPLYGVYFQQHSCVYVNRESFQKSKTLESVKHLTKYQLKSVLVIFPEGTRMDPLKTNIIDKSRKYAEEKGFQPLEYHLTPRITGTKLILDNLKHYIESAVNITIIYEDYDLSRRNELTYFKAPGLFEWFKKRRTVHISIENIPIETINYTDDDGLFSWIYKKFEYKDKLFKQIHAQNMSRFNTKWPLKQGTRIDLSTWETAPQFIFLFSLTLVLWSSFIGWCFYLFIPIVSGTIAIIYFKLFG